MDGDEETFQFMFDHPEIEVMQIDFFLNEILIGVSIIDVMPHGLSSSYFYYDPQHANRSLGTFSALVEIEECLKLGKTYWYLGFVVEACPKMSYKKNFKPQERLVGEEWVLQVPP